MSAAARLAACGRARLLQNARPVKFQAAFAAQPKWLITAEMVCVAAAFGFAGYLTTYEISTFSFYGIPIFIAAWYAGRRAGFGIAVLCGIEWYFANRYSNPYSSFRAYIWAGINRWFYFGFVAVGGTAMRRLHDESRAHIEAITRARNLEQEIVRAGEREQIRIGQDLHDGVCQNLAAIDCVTECLREELETAGLPQAAMAAKIQKYLKETIVEARNLARGIFPVQVEKDGLVSALRDLATKANFIREGSVQFAASGDIRIGDSQVALHFYRIAQEAMSNAARHANSTRIALSLVQQGGVLTLTISDDGEGFAEDENSSEGIGMRTMRHRAQLIGANIAIRRGPEHGTVVECVLNLPSTEPAALHP
jgi:signal transduction histidine kinase